MERGTVVVDGARIACVGDCDTSQADSIVDVRGKTIMPGIVDAHAHALAWTPFTPHHWHESARYLAYGVTTIREPGSGDPVTAFPVAELAGLRARAQDW